MSEDLTKFFQFLNTPEGKTWAANRENPQLSTGGPVVTEGNQWGFDSPVYNQQTGQYDSRGIVWNGKDPAPDDATAQRQIEELLRGTYLGGSTVTRGDNNAYTVTNAPGQPQLAGQPSSPQPQASGQGQVAGSGASSDQLKAFLEYLAGRAGNASPIVGNAPVQPAYSSRPDGPSYGAVVQKGLL